MRHQLLHAVAMLTGAAIGIGFGALLAAVLQMNELAIALVYGVGLLLIPIVVCGGLAVVMR